MGTHPSAPSVVAAPGPYAGQPLLTLVRDHPELLGDAAAAFGSDLPFLFKVRCSTSMPLVHVWMFCFGVELT